MEDKLKILLCEDDENLGMLLREYLQAKDYNTKRTKRFRFVSDSVDKVDTLPVGNSARRKLK